jgi:hypothetical protein
MNKDCTMKIPWENSCFKEAGTSNIPGNNSSFIGLIPAGEKLPTQRDVLSSA